MSCLVIGSEDGAITFVDTEAFTVIDKVCLNFGGLLSGHFLRFFFRLINMKIMVYEPFRLFYSVLDYWMLSFVLLCAIVMGKLRC